MDDSYKLESLYHIFHQVIGIHYYRTHKLLEKEGIYPGQPPLLFALNREDGQSQKELSQKLNIQPATITVMVKRMEKAGLIERKQDQQDQRISRVYLTDQGKIVQKKVAKIIKEIEKECFGNFTIEEQKIMNGLLSKLKENLLSVCGDKFNIPYHKKDKDMCCQKSGGNK